MRSIETLVRSGKLRHGLLLAACMMFVSASSEQRAASPA